MGRLSTPALWRAIRDRASAVETSLTRKENVLTFLVIRFLLMSGMVVAFSWTFLDLNP